MSVSPAPGSTAVRKLCDAVFVYGTLKDIARLGAAAGMGVGPIPLGQGTVAGRLYRCRDGEGEYPIYTEGEGVVHGLVYRLPEPEVALRNIDRYEGATAEDQWLYFRIAKSIDLGTREHVTAWVYTGNPDHPAIKAACVPENLIPTGTW